MNNMPKSYLEIDCILKDGVFELIYKGVILAQLHQKKNKLRILVTDTNRIQEATIKKKLLYKSSDFSLNPVHSHNGSIKLELTIAPSDWRVTIYNFKDNDEFAKWIDLPYIFYHPKLGYSLNKDYIFFLSINDILSYAIHCNSLQNYKRALSTLEELANLSINMDNIDKVSLANILNFSLHHTERTSDVTYFNNILKCLSYRFGENTLYLLLKEAEILYRKDFPYGEKLSMLTNESV